MEIKHLILDLGGVLFDLDYSATQRAFFELGFEQQYSKKAQANVFDELEEGKISDVDFYQFLAENSTKKIKPSDLELKLAWNKMLLGLQAEKLDLLLELKQKYGLFLYSNTNEIHIQAVWDSLKKDHQLADLNAYFDKVYLSHEMGIRKPKSEGFNQIINDNNLDKKATLFIDDSIQHIEGANKAGINALWLDLKKDNVNSLLKKYSLL